MPKGMTYRIVRFYEGDQPSVVIEEGLSLEAAKAHCQSTKTEGLGWFDGFEEEEGDDE